MHEPRVSSSVQAMVLPAVVGIFLAGVFAWLFATALRLPQAHDLPIGLVASDQAATRISAGLESNAPGSFTISRYRSVDELRTAIDERSVVGGFVLGTGAPSILVASGNGEATAGAVTGALTAMAKGMGVQASVADVRPLPASDPHGVVPFFLVLGVSLAGLLYQVFAGLAPVQAPLGARLVAVIVVAALAGLVAAGAVGIVLGFDSTFWLLSLVCACLALTITSTTAALQRLVGRAGFGLSALLVVLLGAACSGGMAGAAFLPDGFRDLSPAMPAGAAIYAARSSLYFDGGGIVAPLVVLAAWSVIAIAVLAAIEVWRHRPAAQTAAAAPLAA